MKYSLLILIAFIMNACTFQTATEEDLSTMNARAPKNSWSQSGMLTPQSNGSAVQMQANFEYDPGPHTVQFLLDGPDESAVVGTRRTVAELTWSVEGNNVTRMIDVVNGTSISGTAQAVRVKVTDDSNAAIADPYLVSIQCVKGSRTSVQQPPYLTTPQVILGAGAQFANVPVPQGAGIISVFVTVDGFPTAIPDGSVVVRQESGGEVLKAYDPREYDWVPLASGTTFIQLRQSAASPAGFWTVTFGIDG